MSTGQSPQAPASPTPEPQPGRFTGGLTEATLSWHVLRLLHATAHPAATEDQEQARAAVLGQMFVALAPEDAWQAARACRLIQLDQMLDTALKAANDAQAEPEKLPKLRASALAVARELRQLEAGYEKARAVKAKERKQTLAAEKAGVSAPAAAETRPPARGPVPAHGEPMPPRGAGAGEHAPPASTTKPPSDRETSSRPETARSALRQSGTSGTKQSPRPDQIPLHAAG